MSLKKDKTSASKIAKSAKVLCKTKCGRKGAVADGWCSICFAKYQKGRFTSSGEIHPDVIRKQRMIEEKKKKLEVKRAKRKLSIIKEELSSKLTSSKLKILTENYPDMNKPKYCKSLEFWTSDTVCYSRLFVTNNKKCVKCKVHDSSLENLLQLTECDYDETAATTATKDQHTASDAINTDKSSTATL
jgi:glycerol kinase